MDVREKLVELFYDNNVRCDQKIEGLADDVMDIIANGVTVQEWVPVDKRMPTQEDAPTEYVFTAYKNQNCYDVGIALWDTVVAYPDLYDYWMALPLPQPPKGE